jgi:hypothetical protein
MTISVADTRPWTAADDEVLRSWAIKRLDARLIGNSNEPNAKCGSFAGQPARHSAAARKAANADELKAKK